MIITLITIAALVLGIIVCILSYRNMIPQKYDEAIALLSLCVTCFSVISILIEITIIIASHSVADKNIYEYCLKREAIVKQVECISGDYEDVSRTMVIANVYDWNKEVYNQKYGAKNLWTSWFYSQKFVDSLEYIELVN